MIGYFIRALLLKIKRNKSDVIAFFILIYIMVAILTGLIVSEAIGQVMLGLLAICAILAAVYALIEAVYRFLKETYIQAKVNRAIEEKQNDQSRQKPHSFHLRS